MIRPIAVALLLTLAAAAPAQSGGTWDELGAGSGTPPGILDVPRHVNSLAEPGRTTAHPRLVVDATNTPRLFVYTQSPNGIAGDNGVVELAWARLTWGAPAGGRAWVGTALGMPRGFVAAAGGGGRVVLAAAATPPGGFITNTYLRSSTTLGAWGGLSGSDSGAGLSGLTTFNPAAQEVAAAVDIVGNSVVAWTVGNSTSTRLHLARHRAGAWEGFAGSQGPTPIATSRPGFRLASPAVAFVGANPVVAWVETNDIMETVRLARWNSGTLRWEGLGDSLTTGLGSGRRVQLANHRNEQNLFVAFEDIFANTLTIREWNLTSWVDRGGAVEVWPQARFAPFDDRSNGRREPARAGFHLVTDQSGAVAVAFRGEAPAGSGRTSIFVSWRQRGVGWFALGTPTSPLGASTFDYTVPATGPGPGNHSPSLAFSIENRPIVAWEHQRAANDNAVVLVRRYSQTIGSALPNKSQAAARVLGRIDANPAFDDRVDFNEDGIIDAADVERLPP